MPKQITDVKNKLLDAAEKILKTEGYEYPLDYCSIGADEEYGNENAKGEVGCTLHYKTIEKMVRENKEAWNMFHGY